jgi:hypothetical protein
VEYIRLNIKFLFVFILPVYFYIVQNSIQNKHTHFYPNGIVVTHSHPVDSEHGQPINEHNHTKTEIVLFQQLNIDSHNIAPETETDKTEFFVEKNFFIDNDKKSTSLPLQHHFKRGPPRIFHFA